MKWSIIHLVILVFVGLCLVSCRVEELSMLANQTNLHIRTGVYRGECIGYCFEEMSVTPDGIIYTKSAFPSDPSQPDLITEQNIEVADWNNLVASIDLELFWRLPRTIGEPDAADQGGEWLEISDGKRTKRVDFVLDTEINEIKSLLTIIRELRREISEQSP